MAIFDRLFPGNYGYNPGDKDITAAADFMGRCLTIEPDARTSALELLRGEWLQDA